MRDIVLVFFTSFCILLLWTNKDQIKDYGLKSVVEEIWEGSNDQEPDQR